MTSGRRKNIVARESRQSPRRRQRQASWNRDQLRSCEAPRLRSLGSFAVQCPTIMLSLARLFQIAFMVTLTLPAAAQAPTPTAQTSPVQPAKQDDAQAIDKWTDFS